MVSFPPFQSGSTQRQQNFFTLDNDILGRMEISQFGPHGNQTGWSPSFMWQRSNVQVSGDLGHSLAIHWWFYSIVVGKVWDGQSSQRSHEVNKNIFIVDYTGNPCFDTNYGFTLVSRQYWGSDSNNQWYLSLSINVLGFSIIHCFIRFCKIHKNY